MTKEDTKNSNEGALQSTPKTTNNLDRGATASVVHIDDLGYVNNKATLSGTDTVCDSIQLEEATDDVKQADISEPDVAPNGNLDLTDLIETTDWDSLLVLHKETLKDIHGQIALVNELKTRYDQEIVGDTKDAFDGLLYSLRDLIKECIEIGVLHSEVTTTITTDNDEEIEIGSEYYTGSMKDEDDAMTYINIASRYVNVQDKTISLISLGWVDLFVTLKLPTDDLTKTINEGIEGVKNAQEGE